MGGCALGVTEYLAFCYVSQASLEGMYQADGSCSLLFFSGEIFLLPLLHFVDGY